MQTVFPAIEPLYASEAAADGSLPIVNINIAGASTYGTNVRRHGLMLKIAKQFVEESTYPWINYWLRLAGLFARPVGRKCQESRSSTRCHPRDPPSATIAIRCRNYHAPSPPSPHDQRVSSTSTARDKARKTDLPASDPGGGRDRNRPVSCSYFGGKTRRQRSFLADCTSEGKILITNS